MTEKEIKTHMCIEAMEKYLVGLRELNCNELSIKVAEEILQELNDELE